MWKALKSFFLERGSNRGSKRRASRHNARHTRLGLEQLEDRLTPAGVVLTPPVGGADSTFGTQIVQLGNGNIVVTDPFWNNNVGAVYLYDGQSGTLLSTLKGTTSGAQGDQVGSGGVTALANGNFVVDSPLWSGGLGAATFGSGTNGVGGNVSSSNSLVGSTAGDQVGSGGITALANGNYLVDSASWHFGSLAGAGAVTFGSGNTGVAGAITSTNSLVGNHASDGVGASITVLTSNNYVVDSPNWNGQLGAVSWGSGTSGSSGVVSASNSLVGATAGDQVGSGGVVQLSNGNYVVVSPTWHFNSTVASAGAVTFGNGSSGARGTVGTTNSLYGSHANDSVGSGGITALTNGNYVVDSPNWNGQWGAVAWGSGTSGLIGLLSTSNSLYGTMTGDLVGSGGVTALSNGNFVVSSPNWIDSNLASAGAVTWGSGTRGIMAALSTTNSLYGSHANDSVGSGGVVALRNGGYVVLSPNWFSSLGGAVTSASGSGISGMVNTGNSLYGGHSGDKLGSGGVTLLASGNYVVDSPSWNGSMGAVTFGNSNSTLAGAVSSSNSLVGNLANDGVGTSITALANGNYVVNSPNWHNNTGAVTLGTGTAGVFNVVSSNNSLLGSTAGDRVGSGGIFVVGNGSAYVVDSPNWTNTQTGASAAGAVTWVNGSSSVLGGISASNSLVGSHTNDKVGSGNSSTNTPGITVLANGNYVVDSPFWNGGFGAVTWGSGSSGVKGIVGTGSGVALSLVGSATTDNVGSGGITALSNGNYVVASPNWNGTNGADTWGNGTTGVSGAITNTNSFVGTATNNQVTGVLSLPQGNYLARSISTGTQAVTFADGSTGLTGTLSAGSATAYNSIQPASGSAQAVSATVTANSATVTFANPPTTAGLVAGMEVTGLGIPLGTTISQIVSATQITLSKNATISATENLTFFKSVYVLATNDSITAYPSGAASLPGSSNFTTQFVQLSNGNYVVADPSANNNTGAVYLYNGETNTLISTLTGSTSGDAVGSGGVTALANGNFVVDSPLWKGSLGAVTWGSGSSGVNGAVSSSNSLVGSTAGDQVGSGGITALPNNNFVVDSPNWHFGGLAGAGAVTFGSGSTGIAGTITSTNSLVGNHAGDGVGTSITVLSNTPNDNYVVVSLSWNGGLGAVSWGSGSSGSSGVVSNSNSLVGATAGDQVGSGGIVQLSNGNYVVISPNWHFNSNGVQQAAAGAVTWASGSSAVVGTVGASNSLYGSHANDTVGSGGVVALTNGSFVVLSPNWFSSLGGAVNWGSGTSALVGMVSTANSLYGGHAGDKLGSAGVFVLSNGDYLIRSPSWDSSMGAVTWASNTAPIMGAVSSTNSLVGATAGDQIGSGGIVQLSNGNYVVISPNWHDGSTVVSAGAVTWGSGNTGVKGTVGTSNSLYGSHANDTVGSGGVTVLPNGSFVVDSPNWFSALGGAVNWGSGTSALVGMVSTVNSLYGGHAGDKLGSGGIFVVGNGSGFVVDSPSWNSGMGAVTWARSTSSIAGTVTTSNSLEGNIAGDGVGTSITVLANGNYVVNSPAWHTNTGAVTLGTGTAGSFGVVSNSNSLVGSTAGDKVGSGGIFVVGNGSAYLVDSPSWNGSMGAVTFVNGSSGVLGGITSNNSLVGSHPNDKVGSSITVLANGNYVVDSSSWFGGFGAVTWGSGSSGVKGIVGTGSGVALSLVGSATTDNVGSGGITALSNGNYVVASPNWSGTNGADTWGNGTTGVSGAVSSSNSFVGTATSNQVTGVLSLPQGNYLARSISAGTQAVTFAEGSSGLTGTLVPGSGVAYTSIQPATGSAQQVSATVTANSATVTFANPPTTTGLAVGMEVTGLGITPGTTITQIVSPTQITLSQNAGISATENLTFYGSVFITTPNGFIAYLT